ncbi:MAG: signal recognition particle subunit SRP19/SEC65 family protein [Candidatus Korarchaeota archaeon]|nr:signal recognition particle subunit SRP19/SEC65 family protein [Thermoproteota archaeon]MCR8462681.1 signal recognition particle subunit SRP19/SEC65 family protein [Thermoproteota archaeon]MCR8470300.1 signal recognition particle subunit SRP19/SEC65 family protein [Thermoproteota archaeon]MCR8471646.1 signal recognition particle subunit SRP19/SEC65 family protein [Thermoproteota archaeon]MCR8472637.1 signal recognition particle subunit SRP19/SEC65 family protein [Thermoproteota archaeon]
MSEYITERNQYWIIYPEHVDYRLSRKLGRKVPLSLAVENPTLNELIKACELLNIPVIVERNKSHPSNWIEGKGRIKIPKLAKVSKHKLLKLLAHKINQIREGKVVVKEVKKETQADKMLKRIIR